MKKKGTVREYVEAFLVAALVALSIRAFAVEAFKIPSGSMIPTLSIGDHIFVNKFIYGPRIPFTSIRLFVVSHPKRGDVVVFKNPQDDGKNYIKRVIGIPGDHIRVEGTEVSINEQMLPQAALAVEEDHNNRRLLRVTNGSVRTIPYVPGWMDFDFFEETVDGTPHLTQYFKYSEREVYEAIVPPDSYFMMGDNRDNSSDSRRIGFVPMSQIRGKALFVWLSLDKDFGGIRWHEFGRWVR